MFSVTSPKQDHPLLRGRVAKYLSGEELKHEFSHTILHNQRIDVGQNKLKDQFNNLKVVNNENVAKKPETPNPERGSLKDPSPRNSEPIKKPVIPPRNETPKGAIGQSKPQGVLPKPKQPDYAEYISRQGQLPNHKPSEPNCVGVAVGVVSPQQAVKVQSVHIQPSREEEDKKRQIAAKQEYLKRVDLQRRKQEELRLKELKEQKEIEKKRREREENEKKLARVAYEKKMKENEMRILKEKECIERQKEEKKLKREQGREAMMQDIARKRKENNVKGIQQAKPKKIDEFNQIQESEAQNSSFCSNKSKARSNRPLSREVLSRNNSAGKLRPAKVSEEGPPYRNFSSKNLNNKMSPSEKKKQPLAFQVELKHSDPQDKISNKVNKPPNPTPGVKRDAPEQVASAIRRNDSQAGLSSRRSSKHEKNSEISGLTNDRTNEHHLFEYTDNSQQSLGPGDFSDNQQHHFGKTAYFIGEPGTGAFNDFKADIMDINKASDEIGNRLLADDLPRGKASPLQPSKVAATNLDFITVVSSQPDKEARRSAQSRRRRPYLLSLRLRAVGDSAQSDREESRRPIS